MEDFFYYQGGQQQINTIIHHHYRFFRHVDFLLIFIGDFCVRNVASIGCGEASLTSEAK